jgi:hypothetical protein
MLPVGYLQIAEQKAAIDAAAQEFHTRRCGSGLSQGV